MLDSYPYAIDAPIQQTKPKTSKHKRVREKKKKKLLPTNANKRIPSNTPNTLQIKLLNHSPKLLLLESRLAQLPRDAPQILQIDKPLPTIIEQLERTQDLIAGITLKDLQRRHGLKSS